MEVYKRDLKIFNVGPRSTNISRIEEEYKMVTEEDMSFRDISVEIPEICPICHTKMNPSFLAGSRHLKKKAKDKTKTYTFWYCHSCEKIYSVEGIVKGNYDLTSSFVNVFPKEPIKIDFSEYIERISPNFVTIYLESLSAESLNHLTICGPGYRKALEFLVKDYLISLDSDYTQSKIEKMKIIDAINLIEDSDLKHLLHITRILGNDKTHYKEIYTDKDVKELRVIIDQIVKFLDYKDFVNTNSLTLPTE